MSHTPRERYEVGQFLPGTSLVVIGTRAETKATVPTTKLVREASLGHLVDALPREPCKRLCLISYGKVELGVMAEDRKIPP